MPTYEACIIHLNGQFKGKYIARFSSQRLSEVKGNAEPLAEFFRVWIQDKNVPATKIPCASLGAVQIELEDDHSGDFQDVDGWHIDPKAPINQPPPITGPTYRGRTIGSQVWTQRTAPRGYSLEWETMVEVDYEPQMLDLTRMIDMLINYGMRRTIIPRLFFHYAVVGHPNRLTLFVHVQALTPSRYQKLHYVP